MKYINEERMMSEILDIYKEVVENWGETEDEKRKVRSQFDDEVLEEYAFVATCSIDRDMGKYINADTQNMVGNFADAKLDYERETKRNFAEMVERLNNGEESDLANEDRDYLTDWYFYAFGTFGLSYNFGDEVNEAMYDEEY